MTVRLLMEALDSLRDGAWRSPLDTAVEVAFAASAAAQARSKPFARLG
jgi:hypothetical protein